MCFGTETGSVRLSPSRWCEEAGGRRPARREGPSAGCRRRAWALELRELQGRPPTVDCRQRRPPRQSSAASRPLCLLELRELREEDFQGDRRPLIAVRGARLGNQARRVGLSASWSYGSSMAGALRRSPRTGALGGNQSSSVGPAPPGARIFSKYGRSPRGGRSSRRGRRLPARPETGPLGGLQTSSGAPGRPRSSLAPGLFSPAPPVKFRRQPTSDCLHPGSVKRQAKPERGAPRRVADVERCPWLSPVPGLSPPLPEEGREPGKIRLSSSHPVSRKEASSSGRRGGERALWVSWSSPGSPGGPGLFSLAPPVKFRTQPMSDFSQPGCMNRQAAAGEAGRVRPARRTQHGPTNGTHPRVRSDMELFSKVALCLERHGTSAAPPRHTDR